MIAKFILIVVFLHGYGPRVNYQTLGEYYDLPSCIAAGNAVNKANKEIDNDKLRAICVAKGEKIL